MLLEMFVALYPGVGDFQVLTVLQNVDVDWVGVILIQDEDVLVSFGR